MIYKVIVNGEKVLVTTSFKSAAAIYEDEIRKAKNSLIIRMFAKKDADGKWEQVRKDWI